MKQIAFLMVAVATVAGVVASTAPAAGHSDEEAAPIFGVKIPPWVLPKNPLHSQLCKCMNDRGYTFRGHVAHKQVFFSRKPIGPSRPSHSPSPDHLILCGVDVVRMVAWRIFSHLLRANER